MVSSFLKFEDHFPFLKIGHYFCPFLNSPKKSLKKKRYKTINRERGLKNRVKKETFWFPFKPFWFPFKPFWFPFKSFWFFHVIKCIPNHFVYSGWRYKTHCNISGLFLACFCFLQFPKYRNRKKSRKKRNPTELYFATFFVVIRCHSLLNRCFMIYALVSNNYSYISYMIYRHDVRNKPW